jgi:hypothetical protein
MVIHEPDEKMQPRRLIFLLLPLALGCAGASAPAAPDARPLAERSSDPELHAILDTVPLDSAAEVALQNYELAHPISFLANLAEVAADPAAGPEAKFHAVRLLGERDGRKQTWALMEALGDRDPRVRTAAVVAAGRFLEKSGLTGLGVVKAALEDREPAVQAKALEVLGPRDLQLLRDFLVRHPGGEAAEIARGLLHAGEDRGAPLAADSAGVLRRVTAGGITLEFRPVRRWPQWDAAEGTVTVGGQTSAAVTISDVEVVAGVVPVFFAPDESALVYEHARRIYVRDLRTGAVREVGSGIAPRPLPFTEDFIYLREAPGGGDLRERTRIEYDVLRAGFRPHVEDPRFVGKTGAFAQMDRHGMYSPARWVRIVEKDARFTLEGLGADTFKLPDPFDAGAVP